MLLNNNLSLNSLKSRRLAKSENTNTPINH